MDAGDFRGALLAANRHLEDDAIVVGADVLPVDATPFVAFGWTAQTVSVPVVDALTAIPVLMTNIVTSSPVVVADVLVMVVVVLVVVMVLIVAPIVVVVPGLLVAMILIVVMILRDGGTAGESEREGRRTEDGAYFSHSEFPPKDGIPAGRAMLYEDAEKQDRLVLVDECKML